MPAHPLNPKHELFSQLYVKNAELFGNATQCYAEAYGFKLDELSREHPIDEATGKESRSEFEVGGRVAHSSRVLA